MGMISSCAVLLGGITVFMLGLRLISVNTDKLSGKRLNAAMGSMTKNKFVACGLGAISTAVAQSSVATNIIAISFVNCGAITLEGACATVIGTNIGTTMTAQLVSLKFAGGLDITVLGAIIAFLGFLLSGSEKEKISSIGYVALGFGLIFISIEIMSGGVEAFKEFEWFNNIFLVKSAPILLLNGFFITAICQSSSVVSSMLVVLASKNVIGFTSAAYLIMGSNIGVCLPVIIASSKKSETARQVAWFNLVFNVFGSIVFSLLFCATRGAFASFMKSTSQSIARQIANFHTFFNLSVGFVVLCLLKPFVRLTKLLTGKSVTNKSFRKNEKKDSGIKSSVKFREKTGMKLREKSSVISGVKSEEKTATATRT